VPIFEALAADAAAHHERLDGRGYHRGLDADGLSPAARILAVADVADALQSDRPYRRGMPPDAVAHVLAGCRGPELCARAVDAAIDVLGTPPRAPRRAGLALR
jgi:HD-GYP domain-containing protein (c-di-GMP phosphodiesterase class II)